MKSAPIHPRCARPTLVFKLPNTHGPGQLWVLGRGAPDGWDARPNTANRSGAARNGCEPNRHRPTGHGPSWANTRFAPRAPRTAPNTSHAADSMPGRRGARGWRGRVLADGRCRGCSTRVDIADRHVFGRQVSHPRGGFAAQAAGQPRCGSEREPTERRSEGGELCQAAAKRRPHGRRAGLGLIGLRPRELRSTSLFTYSRLRSLCSLRQR